MTATGIQLLAQLVAERALNSICEGALIAGVAWLVLQITGKQNSGTRFAVWFSALVAIVGLALAPGLGHGGAATRAMRAEITLPAFWAAAIFAVWAVFASLAAARVLVGLWNIRQLRRSAVALVASELDPALREVLAQCERFRPVSVCSSSMVKVPTAIGFFKPVILIPDWALRELPAEELRIILLHELAHLRRWDDWTNLVQKIVGAAFFFHPAVWWIERRLSLEREMACDDAVLAETGNARAYAECLVTLAEKSFLQRSLAMAQAAIGHARESSRRLAQILDADRSPATRVFKPALGLMMGIVGVCLIALPSAPRLIAFENSVPSQSYARVQGDVPQLTRAAVVPVTMGADVGSAARMSTPQVTSSLAVRRRCESGTTNNERVNSNQLQTVATRQRQESRPIRPVPVAASQSIAAQEVLVVMRTEEFDQQGSVRLSLRVWRVTFTTMPVPMPANAGQQQRALAKSI